ncbi:unnamed protein product [Clonostachys rosea f. rosea IK726]|uniref:Uncharacterized protein n=1 Tax=Clonostachys rosea f. rosea IK726 TaxID=1349383 RepID=A0ACA9UBH9_BIOOC|nr:unnamed protein product [Clonostachys rosea f. rosea IK726]
METEKIQAEHDDRASATNGSHDMMIDHQAERNLVRKLDKYIVPTVMLTYLLCFLDRSRGKVGNACGKSDVDSGGIKDGSNGQGNGLNDERVLVQDDSASIAGNLKEAAKDHADHVTPGLPSDAEVDVTDHDETEDNSECSVDRLGRVVLVDGGLNRTDF